MSVSQATLTTMTMMIMMTTATTHEYDAQIRLIKRYHQFYII